jgi:hypothetical protein
MGLVLRAPGKNLALDVSHRIEGHLIAFDQIFADLAGTAGAQSTGELAQALLHIRFHAEVWTSQHHHHFVEGWRDGLGKYNVTAIDRPSQRVRFERTANE